MCQLSNYLDLLFNAKLRVRFFKEIQDWILKSKRLRKWIFRFCTKQINPRSFGSWCVKETEESTLEVDSSVPLTLHDLRELGLICLAKKRKIHFQILSDLRVQSWIFLKKLRLQALPAVKKKEKSLAKNHWQNLWTSLCHGYGGQKTLCL